MLFLDTRLLLEPVSAPSALPTACEEQKPSHRRGKAPNPTSSSDPCAAAEFCFVSGSNPVGPRKDLILRARVNLIVCLSARNLLRLTEIFPRRIRDNS